MAPTPQCVTPPGLSKRGQLLKKGARENPKKRAILNPPNIRVTTPIPKVEYPAPGLQGAPSKNRPNKGVIKLKPTPKGFRNGGLNKGCLLHPNSSIKSSSSSLL